MKLAGLQKLTLLDYPGHVACTVFTDGCNFRCPFCHNSDLVLPGRPVPALDEGEFFSFLRKRQGILEGVCLTGGEPLLHPDAADFLARVKELGFAVKLDTNGSFPDRLRSLAERSLVDAVAMDVKNSPARYAETVGIPGFDLTPVRESVDFLLSGTVDYEFRTTVVSGLHDEDSFEAIGAWLEGAKLYALQVFRDSPQVLTPGLSPCPQERMERFAAIVRPHVRQVILRGDTDR